MDEMTLFGYPVEISRIQADVVIDFGDGKAILTAVNLERTGSGERGPTWSLDIDKILDAIKMGEERFGV